MRYAHFIWYSILKYFYELFQQFNQGYFPERNKRKTSKVVCYQDYFCCAVENTFAIVIKILVVCLFTKHFQKYIICHSAFCSWCHSFAHLQDENKCVLKVIRDLLRSNARFCVWRTGPCLLWLQTPPSSGRMSPACKCWVWVAVNLNGKMTSVDAEGVNHLYCRDCHCDHGPSAFSVFSKWEDEAGSVRVVPKTHSHLAPRHPPCWYLPVSSSVLFDTGVGGVICCVWLHFPWLCKRVSFAKNSPCPEALSLVPPIGWLHFIFLGGVFFKLQSSNNWQCLLGIRYLEFRDPQPVTMTADELVFFVNGKKVSRSWPFLWFPWSPGGMCVLRKRPVLVLSLLCSPLFVRLLSFSLFLQSCCCIWGNTGERRPSQG